jgi:tryptophan synthase alpha subunit
MIMTNEECIGEVTAQNMMFIYLHVANGQTGSYSQVTATILKHSLFVSQHAQRSSAPLF